MNCWLALMDKKDIGTLGKLAVEWYIAEVGGDDEKPKQIKDFCSNPVFLCRLVNVVARKDLVEVPAKSSSVSPKDKIAEALDALEVTFEAGFVDGNLIKSHPVMKLP